MGHPVSSGKFLTSHTMKFLYRKLFMLLLPALLANYGCFSVRSNTNFTYQQLEPLEYAAALKNSSDYYLIDVRTRNEYDKSHIDKAVNYSILAFHFRRDVRALDRNKPVFVYCQTCHRSPLAARKLKRMGFRTTFDLKGGYKQWPH
jgi:rhodanese-related sulfurtransferase